MGAIEAKVYKGNIALAAKKGRFCLLYSILLHLLFFSSFTCPSYLLHLEYQFLLLSFHTLSLGFLFLGEISGSDYAGTSRWEKLHLCRCFRGWGGRRSAGFWAYSLSTMKGISSSYVFLFYPLYPLLLFMFIDVFLQYGLCTTFTIRQKRVKRMRERGVIERERNMGLSFLNFSFTWCIWVSGYGYRGMVNVWYHL